MPDASGYTGSVEDFTNAHQRVLDVNADVQNTIKQVADTVMGLQPAWTGAAATAFQTMMNRFNTDATNLNNALQAIAEQLGAAGSTYQQQEEAKLDTFGGLSGRLDG
jgi:WXG100 family type VII secretion target